MAIAFISSELDRRADLRTDQGRLSELVADRAARIVCLAGDQVWTRGAQLAFAPPGAVGEALFLGIDPTGAPWFAAPAPEGVELTSLRNLMLAHDVPARELSILAQARSVLGWHTSHRFCSKCGQETTMLDAGYRRNCNACHVDHFPRTDPVVIMAIVEGDAILLGRQPAWARGLYSALAGFLEPGETIEQAVVREAREEAGVSVEDIRYVASQPWPFPSSLMIGMTARACSRELVVDNSELEDAAWFSKDKVQMMLAGTHPDGLHIAGDFAIVHQIITMVVDAL